MEGEKPGPLKEPEQKAQSVTNENLSIAKFIARLFETQALWRICHLQSLNMEMERLKKKTQGPKNVKQRKAEAFKTQYDSIRRGQSLHFDWTFFRAFEQAENKAGHRPLNSYQLPKWVYHPERVNRRTVEVMPLELENLPT